MLGHDVIEIDEDLENPFEPIQLQRSLSSIAPPTLQQFTSLRDLDLDDLDLDDELESLAMPGLSLRRQNGVWPGLDQPGDESQASPISPVVQ